MLIIEKEHKLEEKLVTEPHKSPEYVFFTLSYTFGSGKYLSDLTNASQWLSHIFKIQMTRQKLNSIFCIQCTMNKHFIVSFLSLRVFSLLTFLSISLLLSVRVLRKMAQAATFRACIQEVFCLNFGRDTDYCD
jgi:hypothetical protein